jgi:hypothetical protein
MHGDNDQGGGGYLNESTTINVKRIVPHCPTCWCTKHTHFLIPLPDFFVHFIFAIFSIDVLPRPDVLSLLSRQFVC